MKKTIILFLLILIIPLISAKQSSLSPSEEHEMQIIIDNDAPIIEILNPINNMIYANITPLLVNYSILDISLNSIWYSLNNNLNITITSHFYLSLPEGDYNLIIYANDSFNRINFSEVSFQINNSASFCPNAICDSALGETCNSCPQDCGSCQQNGNGGGGGGGGGGMFAKNETAIKNETKEVVNESNNETIETPTPTPTITPNETAETPFSIYTIFIIFLIIVIFIILLIVKSKRTRWKKKKFLSLKTQAK